MTWFLMRRLAEADRRAAARLKLRSGVRTRSRSGEEGFALLETVVAISLITLVMTAFSVFFVNTVAFTSLQRATQAATTVANSAMDKVRALPVSDVAGATSAALTQTVGSSQTLNGVAYTTAIATSPCAISTGVMLNASCTTAAIGSGINYVRLTVTVTWVGSRCPAAGCSYVTATLLNPGQDPKFAPSQNAPPPPVLGDPGAQTSAVGDVIALPLTVSAVDTYRVNVTGGTLPAGIVLDTATGRLSGSPVTVANATPVTFTLTDGYDRTTSVTVPWTVIPALSANTPPAQSGVIGTAVTPVTVSATGGTTPYTWSDPGATLPPGLSLATTSNNGSITGTPTTVGTYPVTLRVTDAVGRSSPVTFSWRVYAPPTVTAPAEQRSTTGSSVSVQLVNSCPNSPCRFELRNGPGTLVVSDAGLITGTISSSPQIFASVTAVVTDSVGLVVTSSAFKWTVLARPTVTAPGAQQSAAGSAVSLQVVATCPNTPCSYALANGPAGLAVNSTGLITGTIGSSPQTFAAVTVVVTDAAGTSVTSSAFRWTVLPALLAEVPPAQAGVIGSAITPLTVRASGGAAPYTWSDPSASLPPGLSVTTVSDTASVSGTPTTFGTYSVSLRVTDSGGRTSTSTFTWTIAYSVFAAANPGPQTATVGTPDTLQLTATGGSGSFSWSGGDTLPAGLTLSTAGVVSGTPTVAGTKSVTLTATDTRTAVTRSVTFTFVVHPRPTVTAPGAQQSMVGSSVSLQVVATCPNTPCSYALANGPASLAVNSTGLITGTITSAAQTFATVTVSVTDSAGAAVTSSAFRWTVLAPLVAEVPPAQTGVLGTAVTSLTVRASGGTTPYTWSDPGATLPPGLSLATVSDAASISGTPTTFGTYSVTLRVTDAGGRTSNSTFTWTIDYPPFVANNPGPQTSTVGTPDTLQLAMSGGSGSFSWSGGGTLPAGLTLTPAGLVSGTPATAGTSSVTLVATDTVTAATRPVTFSWTVFARPTVAAPGVQQSTVGSAVSLQVVTTCPNTPCSYALANGPASLAVSSTGLITGTVTSGAQTYAGVTVVVTDSAGTAVTSASFTWTVVSAASPVTVVNGDGAVAVSWSPPTGGFIPLWYTVSASPGGASCTTFGLSCTIGGLTNGVVYSVTVTANSFFSSVQLGTPVRAIPYPASVMSKANGLTLWLDGTDPGIFLTSAGCSGATATAGIGCWRDKSGLGQNFAQTTTSSQPSVGSWNGLPAANFADTGDVLNSVNANGAYQTVFTAANILNSGNSALWVDVFGQADADYNVRLGTNGERAAPNSNDWSYNSANTGNQYNWINGAQGVKGSPPGPMITSDQAPSLRTFAASVSNTVYGRGVIGQIGDVITFNRALSTDDRRDVEEYLGRKWGVAITPQAPASATVSNGNNSAVVRWAAPSYNGGSDVIDYKATASNGQSCTTTTLTCTINGLNRNTASPVTVTARNAVGVGPAASAVIQ